MRIIVLQTQIREDSRIDDIDVLAQVKSVTQALEELGHEVLTRNFNMNLTNLAEELKGAETDLVVNLVESVEGKARLAHLAPTFLEFSQIQFTGAGSESTYLTTNKLLAKERMVVRGISTPQWASPKDICRLKKEYHQEFILKSVWEHASLGLDEDSVIPGTAMEKMEEIYSTKKATFGGEWFFEEFIPGREFNVAVLDGPQGPTVLPPAEIRFQNYQHNKKTVVGYRAKWAADSFESQNTIRSFTFDQHDEKLLRLLKTSTMECWNAFSLNGYARVDFRVDSLGKPFVIDINSNPCLSPDAGYQAALLQAEIPFVTAMESILFAAKSRHQQEYNNQNQ